MNTFKTKICNYYELKPTHFPVVGSLSFLQAIGNAGACEQILSLIMQKEFGNSDVQLHITFYGVRNLVFQQPPWSLISIGHMEILLGSELPKIESNYLVRDPEQERIIWFECRDFEAFIE